MRLEITDFGQPLAGDLQWSVERVQEVHFRNCHSPGVWLQGLFCKIGLLKLNYLFLWLIWF